MKHSDKLLQARFESLSNDDLQAHLDYYLNDSDEWKACNAIMKGRKVSEDKS